jgi:A1 cistron-splicing factor AAR2
MELEALYRNGPICIVEGMPSGMEFGIDLHCWKAEEKFKGIKMIPPGLHCIYYGKDFGFRNGLVLYMHEREVRDNRCFSSRSIFLRQDVYRLFL